jgi:hypothetical protein
MLPRPFSGLIYNNWDYRYPGICSLVMAACLDSRAESLEALSALCARTDPMLSHVKLKRQLHDTSTASDLVLPDVHDGPYMNSTQ